jgi:hypothetical protein
MKGRTTMGEDYGDVREEATPDQMQQLSKLADALALAEQDVERREADLKAAQERYRKLREDDVPSLLESIGLKAVKTANGLCVELREEVRATFPKDEARREVAFAWLKEHGHMGLVKHEISMKFGREQRAVADAVAMLLAPLNTAKALKALGMEADTADQVAFTMMSVARNRTDSIHHQTLCAFLREQLRQGEMSHDDIKVFGAFIQKFADVERK